MHNELKLIAKIKSGTEIEREKGREKEERQTGLSCHRRPKE